MKKLNWERIEELFEEVLSLPEEERIPFIDTACADDPELRAELINLLKADSASSDYLEEVSARIVVPTLTEVLSGNDPFLGTRLGPYEVSQVIARGGMGAVYLGRRVDGLFEQVVALKVVRMDMTAELSARFLKERRILAKLEHPSIARILDGGVSSEGRPWLAMEYIKGEPITDWADRKKLSIDQRLELFRSVCEAVSYAHRNLIVHRDLKPSNILVNDDGAVKLLDFGISKLLDESHTLQITHTINAPLTPEYAAPEQLTGANVSLATDVYALGVILYELLTGRKPYRIPSRVRREIERVIIEEEPGKPSTVVTEEISSSTESTSATSPRQISLLRNLDPQALKKRLTGDLDVIILKALRKEPERRYGSVGAFSEDILRHLNQFPVSAQADSAGYRLRKFVRRNRTFVVAATLVMVSLAGGLAIAVWQAGVARQEAENARIEAQRAEELSEFLVGLFEANDPAQAQGDSILVREILDRGLEQIADELHQQPILRSYLQTTMGNIYMRLGMLNTADSLLSQVVATQRELPDVDPIALAETISLLARVYRYMGRTEEATDIEREVLGILETTFPGDFTGTSISLSSLGYLLTLQGAFDEAEEYLVKGYEMEHRLSDSNPTSTLGSATSNLAIMYYYRNEMDQAVLYFEESLQIQRALVGDQPHPDLAISLDNLASLLQMTERFEEAIVYSSEAMSIQRVLYGNQPHPSLVTTLNNHGVLLHHLGRYSESQEILNEVMELKVELYGYEHPSTAITMGWLGYVARSQENYDQAEELYREAIQISERTLPPGHENWIHQMQRLAGMISQLGRWEEAEEMYLLSYERALEHYGPEHTYTVSARRPLAGFYEAWDKPELAAQYRDPAVEE